MPARYARHQLATRGAVAKLRYRVELGGNAKTGKKGFT